MNKEIITTDVAVKALFKFILYLVNQYESIFPVSFFITDKMITNIKFYIKWELYYFICSFLNYSLVTYSKCTNAGDDLLEKYRNNVYDSLSIFKNSENMKNKYEIRLIAYEKALLGGSGTELQRIKYLLQNICSFIVVSEDWDKADDFLIYHIQNSEESNYNDAASDFPNPAANAFCLEIIDNMSKYVKTLFNNYEIVSNS